MVHRSEHAGSLGLSSDLFKLKSFFLCSIWLLCEGQEKTFPNTRLLLHYVLLLWLYFRRFWDFMFLHECISSLSAVSSFQCLLWKLTWPHVGFPIRDPPKFPNPASWCRNSWHCVLEMRMQVLGADCGR